MELANALRSLIVEEGVEPEEIELRVVTAKNKKSTTIPLFRWLEEALRAHISPDARPTGKAFPDGVPNLGTFRKDIDAAGVAYQVNRGHKAVFQSFRNTWCRMLQRSGVPGRLAQELMRHSDRN